MTHPITHALIVDKVKPERTGLIAYLFSHISVLIDRCAKHRLPNLHSSPTNL